MPMQNGSIYNDCLSLSFPLDTKSIGTSAFIFIIEDQKQITKNTINHTKNVQHKLKKIKIQQRQYTLQEILHTLSETTFKIHFKRLQLKSPFFKMKRKFVPLFCNNVFTFYIVFNKNFKTRKSGSLQ